MLKASERVLSSYRDELLPCTSFEEFCDIVGKFSKYKKIEKFTNRTEILSIFFLNESLVNLNYQLHSCLNPSIIYLNLIQLKYKYFILQAY